MTNPPLRVPFPEWKFAAFEQWLDERRQGWFVEPQLTRGSYPSDAAGTPVANGALNPGSWGAVVQAGGQATPGTNVHVFALCGAGPQPVVSESRIALLLPLSAAVLFGGMFLVVRRRDHNAPTH